MAGLQRKVAPAPPDGDGSTKPAAKERELAPLSKEGTLPPDPMLEAYDGMPPGERISKIGTVLSQAGYGWNSGQKESPSSC